MWASGHSQSNLWYVCNDVASLIGNFSSLSEVDQCTTAKFFEAMCTAESSSGSSSDSSTYSSFTTVGSSSFATVEDACDANVSLADLNSSEYLNLFSDTFLVLNEEAESFAIAIPAEDIETECEALVLAVMPSDGSNGVDEANAFLTHVQTTYPGTADHWQALHSEGVFMDIVSAVDYASAGADAGFSFGIVFSSGSPDWEYKASATNYTKAFGHGTYNFDNVPSTFFNTEACKEPTNCPSELHPSTSLYHQSSVLAIQQLVDSWIISQTVPEGSSTDPQVQVRMAEFPHPEYAENGFWADADFAFAILVIIAVMFPVANTISHLVKEKELRIKEGLKMMGLTGLAHTASWVLHFTCLFFFVSLLMILASGSLFENSDDGLIFIFIFSFFMATMSFCFFISAFFSRARTASTIGTLMFFVALFPYFAVDQEGVTVNQRRAACLLPPTCLALGTIPLTEFEDSGVGVTTETAGSSETGFTFNDVIFMLIVDIFVYAVLAWYATNVLPSQWGTTRRPWFIFTKSYWFSGMANREAMSKSSEVLGHDESEGRPSVEAVPDDLRAQVAAGQCVAIRGLTKVYKSSVGGSKLAVDKLDLTMYSGQITALLGHNGAGKTTLLAMLTGMTPATSGSAFIAGRDAVGDMSNIKNFLGVCPQHDILYPGLTVREHLRLYAVLKGVAHEQLGEVIKKTLLDVGLTEKENEKAKTLSGGQKRKLSVGIALIGGSKVVFLDEPTSGMDPHSRRFTWDLIRKNREGRIVVLTTHFMDEADLLGDRVAIMADGKLKCCGSSLFLKKHYGVGYNLTVVRAIEEEQSLSPVGQADGVVSESKLEEGQHDKTDVQGGNVGPIKALVRSHVKGSALLSNVGAELSFQLPNDASSSFKNMLLEMDNRQAELGINSYGVSVTTLEEVFLKVASDAADHKNLGHLGQLRRESSQASVMDTSQDVGQTVEEENGHSKDRPQDRTNPSSFLYQFMALLKKRLLTFGRDKKMWAFVVFMPFVFVGIGTLLIINFGVKDQPALALSPQNYNTGGGAPLPFATECTVDEGTCDPGVLMEWLDNPESAQAVDLELAQNAEPGDAVGELNTALSQFPNSYDNRVFGALSFRQADTTAVTFDCTIHSNYSALHSSPVYLNQINSAILRMLSNDETLSIKTVMHPMPETAEEEEQVDFIQTFYVILFTIMAFSFVPAAWIMYIVREKETKCKHQQIVSGVSLEAYWFSSYVWDFVSYLIPMSFAIILFKAAGVSTLFDNGAVKALVLLFLLFGLSMVPYTYLGSFLFSSHSKAQNLWLFHNFVMGILGPVAISFISNAKKEVKETLLFVLRLFPQVSFSFALIVLGFNNAIQSGGDDDFNEDFNPFSEEIRKSLIYMACETVIYSALVLLVQRLSAGGSCLSGLAGKATVAVSTHSLNPQHLGEGESLDEDVAREAERVGRGGGDGDAIKIDSVTKVYPTSFGAKVAVKSTSLGIPKGQCFGLLGINGAGKSSLLSILSGGIPATSGAASLGGHDVSQDPEAIHRLMGYCPQFDALFETLTGREHLRLYAAIKGIQAAEVEDTVTTMIDELGLGQYADKMAGGYSGGNKRKLSVAIAMIGDPQIVFLDEPSTGMDPMARRMMWKYIRRVVTQNRSCAMILTTHSMEECEALCQRIGIMVGGRMRCLGSSQHLKTRFGKGFQLEARAGAVSAKDIDTMLATIAPATGGQAFLTHALCSLALDAAQCPFASEIAAEGRGSMVYHALANEGTVPARDFAVWVCLEQSCSRIIAFVESSFKGASVREKQNAKMRFEIPQQEDKTLGAMFGVMEDNAADLGVGEYALSQISLEQIFNGFASQQEEEQGRAAGIV
ncbi:unnamed protein product [Pylaiella littoralis]